MKKRSSRADAKPTALVVEYAISRACPLVRLEGEPTTDHDQRYADKRRAHEWIEASVGWHGSDGPVEFGEELEKDVASLADLIGQVRVEERVRVRERATDSDEVIRLRKLVESGTTFNLGRDGDKPSRLFVCVSRQYGTDLYPIKPWTVHVAGPNGIIWESKREYDTQAEALADGDAILARHVATEGK